MLRTVLRPTILGAGSNSASISLGAQSPEHRTHRRGVQTPELQRQRYQFVVPRDDVGQYKVLDNPDIVPPANHVRREAFQRLRSDRWNFHSDQPPPTNSPTLHSI